MDQTLSGNLDYEGANRNISICTGTTTIYLRASPIRTHKPDPREQRPCLKDDFGY